MRSTISNTGKKESPTLVLGAAGRLGDMVMKCWPGPVPPVGASRRAHPDFILVDPCLDPDASAAAMAGMGAVLCLAGATPAAVSQGRDVYSSNTDVALAVLDAAYAAGAGRVFLASSAAVYGGTAGALTETAQLAPPSAYGRAKAEMEQAALDRARRRDQQVTVLRIGNVAGADAILGGWRPGFTLDGLPDGSTPRRSYIGPQDLARVIWQLTQAADLPEILNLSAPGAVEMGALLDAADCAWQARPAPPDVIANVTLETDLLENHVTFHPESGTPAALVAQWRAYQDLS